MPAVDLAELLHELVRSRDPDRYDPAVRFTDEQLAAIQAPLERPASVIAGAGSGKTAVIAARVLWLVGTKAVEPEQVLGLTFTRKATGELSERIEYALSLLGIGRISGLPTVATYDSFSSNLVNEFGPRIGVEPQLRMITDATRYQLAARSVERHGGEMPFERARVPELVKRVLELEADLATHRVSIDDARAFDRALAPEVARALQDKGAKAELSKLSETIEQRLVLLDIVEHYRHAKRSAGLAQFSDISSYAADIAELIPAAAEQLRDRFRVVVLDEYQDTSVSQRDLLVGLFGRGFAVLAVGDPFQAIYGWRGASVSNITGFLRDFGLDDGEAGETLSLSMNTRSDGHLLTAANEIATELRALHHVTQLHPLPGRADAGRLVVGRFEHLNDELDFLVEQVHRVRAEWAGTERPTIAVLTRANTYLPAVQGALADGGIAAEIVGRAGLLYTPEVSDLIATLDVIAEPSANASTLRLLTGPRWRIGLRDLALLGERAEQLVRTELTHRDATSLLRAVEGGDAADLVSLTDAMSDLGEELAYSPEARARFERFSDELRRLRSRAGDPLSDLVARIVAVSGLDIEVAADPAAAQGRGRDAIDTFLKIANDYRDPDGGTGLAEFLGYLRLAMDEERGMDLDDSAPDASADVVQLMTIHKSKGLEWDVVLTPFLYAKGFPKIEASGLWTRLSHVLPWPLRGDARDLPHLARPVSGAALKQLGEDTRQRAADEERRVAYVAFTRARKEHIASSHVWESGKVNERAPSEYLERLRTLIDGAHWGVLSNWAQALDAKTNPYFDVESRSRMIAAPKGAEARRAAVELTRAAIAEPEAAAEDAPTSPWSELATVLVAHKREARSQDRVVSLPMMLSASQTMRLAEDPDRFALELLRPMPRKPSTVARRGTAFHLWVEDHYAQRRPMLDDEDLLGAADDDLEPVDDLGELQQAFLLGPWAERKDVSLEAPFSLAVGGRVLIGRIDAVFAHAPTVDDPSTVHIIDWKTGREGSDPLQLAIYRLAWSKLRGVALDQIRAGFFYVRTGVTKWHDELADETRLAEILSGAESLGS